MQNLYKEIKINILKKDYSYALQQCDIGLSISEEDELYFLKAYILAERSDDLNDIEESIELYKILPLQEKYLQGIVKSLNKKFLLTSEKVEEENLVYYKFLCDKYFENNKIEKYQELIKKTLEQLSEGEKYVEFLCDIKIEKERYFGEYFIKIKEIYTKFCYEIYKKRVLFSEKEIKNKIRLEKERIKIDLVAENINQEIFYFDILKLHIADIYLEFDKTKKEKIDNFIKSGNKNVSIENIINLYRMDFGENRSFQPFFIDLNTEYLIEQSLFSMCLKINYTIQQKDLKNISVIQSIIKYYESVDCLKFKTSRIYDFLVKLYFDYKMFDEINDVKNKVSFEDLETLYMIIFALNECVDFENSLEYIFQNNIDEMIIFNLENNYLDCNKNFADNENISLNEKLMKIRIKNTDSIKIEIIGSNFKCATDYETKKTEFKTYVNDKFIKFYERLEKNKSKLQIIDDKTKETLIKIIEEIFYVSICSKIEFRRQNYFELYDSDIFDKDSNFYFFKAILSDNFDDKIVFLETSVQKNRLNHRANYKLGELQDNLDKKIYYFELAFNDSKNYAVDLAMCYNIKYGTRKAISFLENNFVYRKNQFAYFFELGKLYFKENEFLKAENSFQKAISIKEDFECYVYLADSLEGLNRFENSILILEKSMFKFKSHVLILKKIKLLNILGNSEESLFEINRLNSEINNSEFNFDENEIQIVRECLNFEKLTSYNNIMRKTPNEFNKYSEDCQKLLKAEYKIFKDFILKLKIDFYIFMDKKNELEDEFYIQSQFILNSIKFKDKFIRNEINSDFEDIIVTKFIKNSSLIQRNEDFYNFIGLILLNTEESYNWFYKAIEFKNNYKSWAYLALKYLEEKDYENSFEFIERAIALNYENCLVWCIKLLICALIEPKICESIFINFLRFFEPEYSDFLYYFLEKYRWFEEVELIQNCLNISRNCETKNQIQEILIILKNNIVQKEI
ncbi:hypothetical protein CWI37_1183p0020 [Hamiltosporidium tvaerminnensis]|uniref:Tetratricopeptide repeat protein n=1 Tax=Hamiltosporidium tvaerminnensis TaxID=1176355 RepID=A0A4Q9KY27_9MICR|nr:hypothetical protein CWI37_1183p0020 [Hamiltosporidium tvaerminnensis]